MPSALPDSNVVFANPRNSVSRMGAPRAAGASTTNAASSSNRQKKREKDKMFAPTCIEHQSFKID
jgi:hypothetical protein